MATIQKRCPECRGKKKIEGHECSPHKVSYHVVYWEGVKQKSKYAGCTKREADDLKKRIESNIRGGDVGVRSKVLFDGFVDSWLENVKRPRVKQSTFQGYQADVKLHLKPFFGHRYIDEIRQEHVEAFMAVVALKPGRGRDKSEKTLDAKTINNIRLTLSMLLDYAKKLKHIVVNPVDDVPPFKVIKKEMDFLRPDEIRVFLDEAREPFKTLFTLAILTGMRSSEISALQWGDIDWLSNTIFVRRSITWIKKSEVPDGAQRWKFITPKSKGSIRALVMSPKLKEALEIHRVNQMVSLQNPHDMVFTNRDGGVIDMDHVYTREFLPTLTAAGLRRIRFHDLRHTRAAILIAQGENIKFIQVQMGHASIQTTMDTYGHLFPVNHTAVGEKTDVLVFGSSSNTGLTSLAQATQTNAKSEEAKAHASL